jgi:hypothetical protein
MDVATSPAGFPSGIEVHQVLFQNWDKSITVPEMWTCVPSTEADVVTVCNWAVGAKYQVRPRGIMHNWSPITIAANAVPGGNIMLVDTTKWLTAVHVDGPIAESPAQVWAQTGATMNDLMATLENADGGEGAAPGFSFAHIPAPGHITVGGALAINAHGTAIRTDLDDLNVAYGSLSNQILAFTAVISDPEQPGTYVARDFHRGEGDDKAFLAHLGRAFLLNVTLQVCDNYNLRCQSLVDITAAALFASPTASDPAPYQSFASLLAYSGRVEVIWFPVFPANGVTPPSYPWVKVWTLRVSEHPITSRVVDQPYNYPFSDNLPAFLTTLLDDVVTTVPSLTPEFCSASAAFTIDALQGGYGFEDSTDLWGPSKNTLLYVKDTTLLVTANGYAVQMRKADVQQAVADFTTKFTTMLEQFMSEGLYPINSPLEIRVTNLDDPSKIVSVGHTAQSPVISSLSLDPVAIENGWDVAVWFDVLTVQPAGDPQRANDFYAQLEAWVSDRFSTGARVMPEWSKGWGYTASGAWTDDSYMQTIRQNFTTDRASDDNWEWEKATLAKYDSASLFHTPLLDQLFGS